MTDSWVEYTVKGHIAAITLQRNEGGPEIGRICTEINGDENIYAVVVKGRDGYFARAEDLPPAAASGEMPFSTPAEAIGSLNRPVIAALDGDVLGAGLEAALACDLRIAVDSARFALPQIERGQIPSQGGTQRLARLIGKGKAMEMVLSGESISAAEALEIGLVNKLVKAEELECETEALAEILVTKAPLAVRYCKEAVNKGLDLSLEQGLRLEADLYFLLHTTSDRSEGVRSYLEKRKPDYQGK